MWKILPRVRWRHSRGTKFYFLTVRNRGIRASAIHMMSITARHAGSLNRGTKGGGSIFVQTEHFPQIAGGLAICEGRSDCRGAVHHQRDQSGAEDRHRDGDSALCDKGSNEKNTKTGLLSKAPPAPSRTPTTAQSSPGLYN